MKKENGIVLKFCKYARQMVKKNTWSITMDGARNTENGFPANHYDLTIFNCLVWKLDVIPFPITWFLMISKNQFLDLVNGQVSLLDVVTCQHAVNLDGLLQMVEIQLSTSFTRLIPWISDSIRAIVTTNRQPMTIIRLKMKKFHIDVLNAKTYIMPMSWITWIICGRLFSVISVGIEHAVSHVTWRITIKTLEAEINRFVNNYSVYLKIYNKICHWKKNSQTQESFLNTPAQSIQHLQKNLQYW